MANKEPASKKYCTYVQSSILYFKEAKLFIHFICRRDDVFGRFAFQSEKNVREIELALRKYGHRLKFPKVKYYSKTKHKPITGTVVTRNHTLEIPNRFKNVYYGFQKAKIDKILDIDECQTLIDRIQSAKNINSNRFSEIRRLTPMITQ